MLVSAEKGDIEETRKWLAIATGAEKAPGYGASDAGSRVERRLVLAHALFKSGKLQDALREYLYAFPKDDERYELSAYNSFQAIVDFDPVREFAEVVRQSAAAGVLAPVEEDLREQVRRVLDGEAVEVSPCTLLASLYLLTDRDREALQLFREWPDEVPPGPPEPLFMALANPDRVSREGLECLEEWLVRWPHIDIHVYAESVARLFERTGYVPDVERLTAAVRRWHEKRAALGGRQVYLSSRYYSPVHDISVFLDSDLHRANRALYTYRELVRVFWKNAALRPVALRIVQAAQPFIFITERAGGLDITLPQDDTDAATALVVWLARIPGRELVRRPELFDMIWSAEASSALTELVARLGEPTLRSRIQEALEKRPDGGTTPSPVRLFLEAALAAIDGEPARSEAAMTELRDLLQLYSFVGAAQQRWMYAVLALEPVLVRVDPETADRLLLRLAEDLREQLSPAGASVTDLTGVLRCALRLRQRGKADAARKLCEELVFVLRANLFRTAGRVVPAACFYEFLQDPVAAQLALEHLITPVLDSLPDELGLCRARWELYARWARATLHLDQSPGISIALCPSEHGDCNLVWQVSTDLPSSPFELETLEPPYGAAWLRYISQPFVDASRAVRPDKMTVVVETSADGHRFREAFRVEAIEGWSPEAGTGQVRLPHAFDTLTWLRVKLLKGNDVIATSLPVAAGGNRVTLDNTRLYPYVSPPLEWDYRHVSEHPVVPHPVLGSSPTVVVPDTEQLVGKLSVPLKPDHWYVVTWVWRPLQTAETTSMGSLMLGRARRFRNFLLPIAFGKIVFEQRLYGGVRYTVAQGRVPFDRSGGLGPIVPIPATGENMQVRLQPLVQSAVALRISEVRAADESILQVLMSEPTKERSTGAQSATKK